MSGSLFTISPWRSYSPNEALDSPVSLFPTRVTGNLVLQLLILTWSSSLPLFHSLHQAIGKSRSTFEM